MQDQFESATQGAQASAGAARDEMRRAAADPQEQFADAAETAKETLGEAAESVKKRARAMADDQKAAGARRLSGLARAISLAADEMDGELPQAAGFVREAAAQVDNVSTMIRERSIEDLVYEANEFARANPVVFFGASLAAGFALARFLKSAKPSQHPAIRRGFRPPRTSHNRTRRARLQAPRRTDSPRFPRPSSDQETLIWASKNSAPCRNCSPT